MVRKVGEELWGKQGYDAYLVALNAAHRFAQYSDAPPGVDVFRWLSEKHTELCLADNHNKIQNPPS